jgi:hypothetical protein
MEEISKMYVALWSMWRVWGRTEVCTGCWWGILREIGHYGDQDVDGRIILRWIFRKFEGVVGIGWSWLRIGGVWRALVGTVRNFRVP